MGIVTRKIVVPDQLYDRFEINIAIAGRIQEIKTKLEAYLQLKKDQGWISKIHREEARELITELQLISSYTHGADEYVRICSAILLYDLKAPDESKISPGGTSGTD